jgi:hypothetical protein
MSYKLSTDKRYQYSALERRAFALLSSEPRNTIDLVEAFYPKGKERPLFPRETVTYHLSALMRKLDNNNEPFCIIKSKRRGSVPIEWHLAPRQATPTQHREYMKARLRIVKNKIEAA